MGDRNLIRITFCLALVLALAGCATTGVGTEVARESALAGKVSGNTYHNQDLGLAWLAPSGWRCQAASADQASLVGWEHTGLGMMGHLWLMPRSTGEGPSAWGLHLAQTRGWELREGREIAWQGRACWDGEYQAGGKVLRARVLDLPSGLLVVAVEGDEARQKDNRSLAVELVEGLRVWPPADLLHTVKRGGESLDLVALWYTGRASNWKALKDYNHLGRSALSPGDEVRVPRSLAWRLDPMPAWMPRLGQAASQPPSPGRKSPSAAPPAAAEDSGEGLENLDLAPAGPK